MNIDLNALEPYGRVAVHCTTEEQAKIFVEAMWEQHPEKMRRAWSKGQTNWSKYSNEDIYYVPRIFHDVDVGEYSHMQSSSLEWLEDHHYAVVEFSVLLQSFDLGELDHPEFDIKSFFDKWVIG